MRLIGNILWFLLGGFVSGMAWVLSGAVWCITFRRIRQRYGLGPVRSCLVHHHHRNTVWPAVFQTCRLIFLAVRKKDRIRRRSCFIYCKCNLVPAQWLVDGPRKFGDRMCVVHHHHWNSVRNTVFQDCETVPESVWGNYCS